MKIVWQLVLAALGALAAAVICLCFMIGAWHGIDRREASRHYSGPDRRHPKTGDRP